jgi:hypothetical protein
MTRRSGGPGTGRERGEGTRRDGIANLHNVRRARTPLLNAIGDQATWHLPHDAPLTSDIAQFGDPVVLLLCGATLSERALHAVGRIAAATWP